jgi:hypothetical protein
MSEIKPINPSNRSASPERKRIPMAVPVQKLSVPDIPGYHLHWFQGDAGPARTRPSGWLRVRRGDGDLRQRRRPGRDFDPDGEH